MQVLPDYTEYSQTTDQIKEMVEDFKGPGMYLSDGHTVLVVPSQPRDNSPRAVWAYQQPRDQTWEIHIWNTTFAGTIFAVSCVAPTRRDSRNLGGSDGG